MSNFDTIAATPEALGNFLASLPVLQGPWDDEFHKRYCRQCNQEYCDHCQHDDKRNNPAWWLGLGDTDGKSNH